MATKNDAAWETYVRAKGWLLAGESHYVRADDLKRVTGREPRLLTKFDTPSELPRVFRVAGYTILPVKNGEYVIFPGSVFASLPRPDARTFFRPRLPFPLTTIGRGTGESEYLDHAYTTGLLAEVTGCATLFQTIRGRERSGAFSFSAGTPPRTIAVDGVQIEVDAGYEGERDVILVEAKVGARDVFNVRQLYYPFRHFSRVTDKRVRPFFFTYDLALGTYTFYEVAFTEPASFHSYTVVAASRFALFREPRKRVDDLLEPHRRTLRTLVPQADDLTTILALLVAVNKGNTRSQTIAAYIGFDKRQSSYYGEAAEYLGLLTRDDGVFALTDAGRAFLATAPEARRAAIAKRVVNSWVVRDLIDIARKKGYTIEDDIAPLIATVRKDDGTPRYSGQTIERRVQTITAWLRWLANEFGLFRVEANRFFLTG